MAGEAEEGLAGKVVVQASADAVAVAAQEEEAVVRDLLGRPDQRSDLQTDCSTLRWKVVAAATGPHVEADHPWDQEEHHPVRLADGVDGLSLLHI